MKRRVERLPSGQLFYVFSVPVPPLQSLAEAVIQGGFFSTGSSSITVAATQESSDRSAFLPAPNVVARLLVIELETNTAVTSCACILTFFHRLCHIHSVCDLVVVVVGVVLLLQRQRQSWMPTL